MLTLLEADQDVNAPLSQPKSPTDDHLAARS